MGQISDSDASANLWGFTSLVPMGRHPRADPEIAREIKFPLSCWEVPWDPPYIHGDGDSGSAAQGV